MKKKGKYNPYSLPPWLRQTRFLCKSIAIPITVFQLIRTLIFPTAGDFLLLIFLIIISWLFSRDFI